MSAHSQDAAEKSLQGLDLYFSDGCSAQRFADFMAGVESLPCAQAV